MEQKQAEEIVGKLIGAKYHEMGIIDEPTSIEGLTLAQLVEANRLVVEANKNAKPDDNGKTRHHMSCDDRLTAAIYVAAHYPGNDPMHAEPIVVYDDKAVLVVDVSDMRKPT